MNEASIARAAEIVAEKCGNAGYCTLALMDADGYPTAATISVSKAEGIQWITFCTGLGSNWVKRIERCDRASVCFNAAYNITLGLSRIKEKKREKAYANSRFCCKIIV